jgi:hypothetical protein
MKKEEEREEAEVCAPTDRSKKKVTVTKNTFRLFSF